MAGRGPAPKAPGKRVRRNVDTTPTTIIEFVRAEQPELPDDIPWPDATQRWWAMWATAPIAQHFTVTDWDFLMDTALLHASVWAGDLSYMAELRLRVAKFGATPEDRARLRIQFAEADEADGGQPAAKPAGDRYASVRQLHSVPAAVNE